MAIPSKKERARRGPLSTSTMQSAETAYDGEARDEEDGQSLQTRKSGRAVMSESSSGSRAKSERGCAS